MKVLIIGSDDKFAIENYYFNHLKKLTDVDIELFPVNKFKIPYFPIAYKLENKIFPNNNTFFRNINKYIINHVLTQKPEIIIVFKGMEIFPETLKTIKTNGIKLVNYNPDNPLLFTGPGSGNKNVKDSIDIFDLYLTYDNETKYRLEKEYKIKSAILPFGYEHNYNFFNEIDLREEEIKKVCFIGNPDKQRANFISEFSRHMPIVIYGSNWKRYLKTNSNIELNKPVTDVEFFKTIFKYRVQLNLMRVHNENSHNMRTFEIPSIGGIGLMPKTPDHDYFFTNEKDFFSFLDIIDCVEKSKMIISLPFKTSYEIRQNAFNSCINYKYNYENRSILLHKYLKQYLNI